MTRQLLATVSLLIIATATTSSAFAFKGKFPGTGRRGLWEKSTHTFDEGVAAARAKNYTRSEQLYREAIKQYPYDPDYYLNLGVALSHQNRWNEAEPVLKKAVSMNAKDFAPVGEYAAVLLELHKYNLAKQYLDRAAKLPKTKAEEQMFQSNLNDARMHLRTNK